MNLRFYKWKGEENDVQEIISGLCDSLCSWTYLHLCVLLYKKNTLPSPVDTTPSLPQLLHLALSLESLGDAQFHLSSKVVLPIAWWPINQEKSCLLRTWNTMAEKGQRNCNKTFHWEIGRMGQHTTFTDTNDYKIQLDRTEKVHGSGNGVSSLVGSSGSSGSSFWENILILSFFSRESYSYPLPFLDVLK